MWCFYTNFAHLESQKMTKQDPLPLLSLHNEQEHLGLLCLCHLIFFSQCCFCCITAKQIFFFFSSFNFLILQTTKAFLPRMLELQNGHIVCLNSVLALSAIPGAIDYCTSKASSFAFMESLTLGLLDCPGVNATTVLPFHTSTEMFQGMRIRSVQGN